MTAIKLETRRSERGEGRTVITLGCDGPSCTVQVRSDEDEAMEAWWFLLGAESGDLHFHTPACHMAWATQGLRPLIDEFDANRARLTAAEGQLERLRTQYLELLVAARRWTHAAGSEAGSVDSGAEYALLQLVDDLNDYGPIHRLELGPDGLCQACGLGEQGSSHERGFGWCELCEEAPDSEGWCAYHRAWCTSDGAPAAEAPVPPSVRLVPNERGEPERALLVEPNRASIAEHLVSQHATDPAWLAAVAANDEVFDRAHRAQHRALDREPVWGEGEKHWHEFDVETAGTACPEDPDGQHFVGCGCDADDDQEDEAEPSAAQPIPPVLHR